MDIISQFRMKPSMNDHHRKDEHRIIHRFSPWIRSPDIIKSILNKYQIRVYRSMPTTSVFCLIKSQPTSWLFLEVNNHPNIDIYIFFLSICKTLKLIGMTGRRTLTYPTRPSGGARAISSILPILTGQSKWSLFDHSVRSPWKNIQIGVQSRKIKHKLLQVVTLLLLWRAVTWKRRWH